MENYVIAMVDSKYADPFILPSEAVPELSKIKGRDYDKALSAYNYILDKISYESAYPRQRNALEVFNEKKGNCIEQSFLYVAIARFLGLDSKLVLVYENFKGDRVNHACACADIDGLPLLVDLAYQKFAVSHNMYEIIDDDMVRERRKSYTANSSFNPTATSQSKCSSRMQQ